MTDRELLELAAKAAGIVQPVWSTSTQAIIGYVNSKCLSWNPLTDDSDALKLAVKFEFDIEHHEDSVFVNHVGIQNYQLLDWHNGDRLAATRRAIVKLAAEIGKQMEKS